MAAAQSDPAIRAGPIPLRGRCNGFRVAVPCRDRVRELGRAGHGRSSRRRPLGASRVPRGANRVNASEPAVMNASPPGCEWQSSARLGRHKHHPRTPRRCLGITGRRVDGRGDARRLAVGCQPPARPIDGSERIESGVLVRRPVGLRRHASRTHRGFRARLCRPIRTTPEADARSVAPSPAGRRCLRGGPFRGPTRRSSRGGARGSARRR